LNRFKSRADSDLRFSVADIPDPLGAETARWTRPNGLDIARLTPQPLSTIRSPRVAMGETGAKLLLAGGAAQVVDLGFELIEGATS